MFDEEKDVQEIITFLNQKLSETETDADIMKLCCVLLRYAHEICSAFTEFTEETETLDEIDENEETEGILHDTDIG